MTKFTVTEPGHRYWHGASFCDDFTAKPPALDDGQLYELHSAFVEAYRRHALSDHIKDLEAVTTFDQSVGGEADKSLRSSSCRGELANVRCMRTTSGSIPVSRRNAATAWCTHILPPLSTEAPLAAAALMNSVSIGV